MKRSDVLALGVPEEKLKEFQARYWEDVHKCAEKRAGVNAVDQKGADETSSLLEAITAMVKLMPDPVRLRMILSNVNRHYAQYTHDQRENQTQHTASADKRPLEE